MIAGGMDIAAVSQRLGHETTALTVDTYYHLMPQTKSLALSILEAAMPVTPPGPAVRDA
jgi:integrase